MDLSLRFTCWCYPWVDGCKEMVGNKESLIVNGLLLFMMYFSWLFISYQGNLQTLIFFFLSTGLSMIQNLTIPARSLFNLVHLLPLCLLLELFSGVIYRERNVLSGQWVNQVKTPGRSLTADSGHDPGYEQSSQLSWSLHNFQLLTFLWGWKGFYWKRHGSQFWKGSSTLQISYTSEPCWPVTHGG